MVLARTRPAGRFKLLPGHGAVAAGAGELAGVGVGSGLGAADGLTVADGGLTGVVEIVGSDAVAQPARSTTIAALKTDPRMPRMPVTGCDG